MDFTPKVLELRTVNEVVNEGNPPPNPRLGVREKACALSLDIQSLCEWTTGKIMYLPNFIDVQSWIQRKIVCSGTSRAER